MKSKIFNTNNIIHIRQYELLSMNKDGVTVKGTFGYSRITKEGNNYYQGELNPLGFSEEFTGVIQIKNNYLESEMTQINWYDNYVAALPRYHT